MALYHAAIRTGGVQHLFCEHSSRGLMARRVLLLLLLLLPKEPMHSYLTAS
jgi:hypothetical protein